LIIDTDERYEAYLPMLDNAIAILQYDNGLTTESVQELIKKTMHANPMYTAMVLSSIKVKNPSV
jgi:hypothetical protein